MSTPRFDTDARVETVASQRRMAAATKSGPLSERKSRGAVHAHELRYDLDDAVGPKPARDVAAVQGEVVRPHVIVASVVAG
jgi:hypothetical protein